MTAPATLTPARAAHAAASPDFAALVGPRGWQRLPPAVRRRFAAGHHATCYEGSLDLSCSAVGRLFAWASLVFRGPLLPLVRTAVPAAVGVYGDGQGGVVWERRLRVAPSAAPQVVRSTKRADGAGLVERTDGGLAMELDVFEEGGALVFRSRRYFLALAGRRLRIPMLLTPGVCRVEHRDLGQGRFRFSLSMVHPWWGTTFRQSGVFIDPKEDQA
jgi:hypothetical protein